MNFYLKLHLVSYRIVFLCLGQKRSGNVVNLNITLESKSNRYVNAKSNINLNVLLIK